MRVSMRGWEFSFSEVFKVWVDWRNEVLVLNIKLSNNCDSLNYYLIYKKINIIQLKSRYFYKKDENLETNLCFLNTFTLQNSYYGKPSASGQTHTTT